jgi:hypothetical protein
LNKRREKEEGNRKKRDSVERVKEKNIRRKGELEDVSHLWCEHFYRLLYSSRDTEKGGRRGKRHSEEFGRKEILPLICQFFVWHIPAHS